MASLDKHLKATNIGDANPAIADIAANAYSPNTFTNSNMDSWSKDVREATRSFTSQELPGIPKDNKDCGPTSLVAVLKSKGIFSDNGNAAAQEAATRLRMTGADDPFQGTSVKQLLTAAQSYGLDAQKITGIAELNTALAHGKTVIEGGAPTFVSKGVNFEGNNINSAPSAHHFVTVFGLNPRTGNYLVDNSAQAPGSGPQEKTAAQMKAFIADTGLHSGIAVSPYSNLKLAKSGLSLSIPEIKSTASISETHRNSFADKFRRAADIDIQVPLLTLRF